MITALKMVKRMRGRSRAVHIEADNGWHYVVKPKIGGNRHLINELLGARLLQALGLMCGDVRPIRIPSDLAKECWSEWLGGDMVAAASAFPVNPLEESIFDFLPPALSDKVANLDHVIGFLAVDLWTGKTEPRQFVCFRQGPWWACAVDHKGMFGGDRWDGRGLTNPANPAARWAYDSHLASEQIALWSEQISHVSSALLERIFLDIPDCWVDDRTASDLSQLADLLLSRRDHVPAMLRCAAGTSPSVVGSLCGSMALNASCPLLM